ncbi:hypothetical protein JCM9279_006997 [Rhodotorula babjevae]
MAITSQARLFFGVLVSALDLVIAARAWPRRKVLSVVFGSFVHARAQGRLVLLEHVGPVLLRVPPDFWTLIESHAAVALLKHEEHKLVRSLHARGAGYAECDCTVCARDEHLTLIGHEAPLLEWSCLGECDACDNGFLQEAGTQGLMDDHQDVRRPFLRTYTFKLALVDYRTVSCQQYASSDVDAAAAIGLPIVSTARARTKPAVGEWIDDVERLNPSFFVLPPDAQDRFRLLLQTCAHLSSLIKHPHTPMCVSSARLFFGLTVPALDLVIAANAWPVRRRLARTINGVAALRESGQLKVKVAPKDRHKARSSPASVLHRVPGEVWQLIKVHLMAAAWEDAEHALVWRCHNAGREICMCRACARASSSRAFVECDERVLRLEEFGTCDECDKGYVALGGGEGLLDLHREAIKAILKSFRLAIVATLPLAPDCPRYIFDSSIAVSLPDWAQVDTEAPHGEYDYEHHLATVEARFFATVPDDAQMRFARLLASFPLEVTDETSGEVGGPHTVYVRRGDKVQPAEKDEKKKKDKGRRPKRGEGGGGGGGGGPAKWHLWSSVCDCG